MNSPLFITARFRTGSTMLWNFFHHLHGCRSFYEPLHESLISYIKYPFQPQKSHFFVNTYFDEYENARRALSLYNNDFAIQRLYLESDASYPELEAYIQALVESVSPQQTAVLQFNRIDFRLPWIKKNFPEARLLHLTRNPRDQWYSTLAAYDVDIDHSIDFDTYNLVTWARDLYNQFPFIATPQIEHAYQRYYYLWKLSFLAGQRLSGLSVAYEDILAEPRKHLIQILNFSNLYSDDNLETCLKLVETKPDRAWSRDRSDDWFLDLEQKCEAVLDDLGLNQNFALLPLTEIQTRSLTYQSLLNDPQNDRWATLCLKRAIISERNSSFELNWNLDQSYKNAIYERDKIRTERDEVRVDINGVHLDLQGLRGDLENVRIERNEAREELNGVRLDLQEIRGELEQIRIERNEAREDLDGERLELQRIRAYLELERNGREKLQSEFAEIRSNYDKVQAERDQIQAELDHVYHSRSYRITSPFRAIFGAVRIWKSRLSGSIGQPAPTPLVNYVNHDPSAEPVVPVYMQFGDQKIDLDEIMEKIRAEVSRRNIQIQQQDIIGHPLTASTLSSFNQQETRSFRLIKRVQLTLQKLPFYLALYNIAIKFKPHIPKYQKQELTLTELIKFDDEDFVRNAYIVILRRGPDQGGFDNYLSKLRSGTLSKAAILGRLRYSREGRRIGVTIKGLSVGYYISSFFQK